MSIADQGENSKPLEKPTVSIRETIPVWGKIGILSFGGPAAQIALMHRILVEEKGWLNEKQYLNALSFCMLLPGPEAMQLATYAGWKMHGTRGGLIAGLLFILPGAAIILALSVIYVLYGTVPILEAAFIGIKAAVLIIVMEALLKVAKRSLKGIAHWVSAGLAFIALFFLNLPFPLVILLAGAYGFLMKPSSTDEVEHVEISVSPSQTIKTIIFWLVIWFSPLIVIEIFTTDSILIEVGLFFSKLAAVTFGGAYAVLAYMAQDASSNLGWLTAEEMLDGLGMAESTPGPLILVTEFVGFLAGARAGGTLNITMGLWAAAVTLWVTFVPCFLWVFTGAPYIEWLGTKPRLRASLANISAAVVGVILNLSIWFSLHVLFDSVTKYTSGAFVFWVPELASINLITFAIAIIATILLVLRKWSVFSTLGSCAVLAVAVNFIVSF